MALVSFANDIKPMFRPVDVNHMKPRGVKLDDYSYMSDPGGSHKHAQEVEDRLKDGTMPPDKPWTTEQIDLCVKWRSDGYQP